MSHPVRDTTVVIGERCDGVPPAEEAEQDALVIMCVAVYDSM